jgi:hypothetical protein
MTLIELRSKVGPDGVLTVSVPVGLSEANRDVRVVVESIEPGVVKAPTMTPEEWRQFIAETAGAWKGDLERPEQGDFEQRNQWQ